MTQINQKTREVEAYEKKSIEDLSINEALLLVLLCAIKEKTGHDFKHIDHKEHIVDLVGNHPVFSGCKESIEPIINKFINFLSTKKDLLNPVHATLNILSPELRETAFVLVVKIIAPGGVLLKERKMILDRYALLLKIDNKIAQKIIIEVSKES